MANVYFNNVSDFVTYMNGKLNQSMRKVMDEDVAKVVKVTEQRNIVDEVYLKYRIDKNGYQSQPFMYNRRRGSDGLMALKNMTQDVSDIKDGVQLSIRNITRGTRDSFDIAPLVEYGDGYGGRQYEFKTNRDGTAYQYLRARPFTRSTIDELRMNKEHVTVFTQGMENEGFKLVRG